MDDHAYRGDAEQRRAAGGTLGDIFPVPLVVQGTVKSGARIYANSRRITRIASSGFEDSVRIPKKCFGRFGTVIDSLAEQIRPDSCDPRPQVLWSFSSARDLVDCAR